MKYDEPAPRRILELSHAEAKDFFLKHESYFSQDMPAYIQAGGLLRDIDDVLEKTKLSDCLDSSLKPNDFEDVNHKIVGNKDGKLSWRPFQLIHPVLYVDLVREMTTKENWETLCARFREMHSSDKIRCLSMPREATKTKDRAESVTYWWKEVELASVEYALDYDLFYETDISDCYGSIYTHSIVWAVEGKEEAKKNRNKKWLGGFIDKSMQNMQNGQTNGIPQGSALMDFIAELVLGYIDIELTRKISEHKIVDFQILRYRDDYRVFVNDSQSGEKILKILAEVLANLGMRLNSSKTGSSDDVVDAALKKDKKAWISKRNNQEYLFKQAMLIKLHADKHPNSGSLRRALSDFKKRLEKDLQELDVSAEATISVIVDIAYRHPTTYPVCFAILSKYFSLLDDEKKEKMIKRISTKFTRLSNVGYMEVWFQRAILANMDNVDFNEPLCKLVKGEEVDLWNSQWIDSTSLRAALKSSKLIDQEKLNKADVVITNSEFSLYEKIYG